MSYEKLLESKKIAVVEIGEFDLAGAEGDLKSAGNSFGSGDFDWALSIAYNAVLRASSGFMGTLGYRAIGREHHKNVFEFLRLSGVNQELVEYFDGIRKMRNRFIYGVAGVVSEDEARIAIEKAKVFVQEIRTIVQKNGTGAKDE